MTALTSPPNRLRHLPRKPEITLKAAVILAALGLSACGLTQGPPPAKAGAPAGPSALPSTAQPGTALAAKPPETPKKAYPALSVLAGMATDQVIGLLGPPRFKRRDNPAEIWQYRNKACALDLFLYQAGTGAAFRVRHFETRRRDRGLGAEKNNAKACFISLLQEHETRPQG